MFPDFCRYLSCSRLEEPPQKNDTERFLKLSPSSPLDPYTFVGAAALNVVVPQKRLISF